MEKPESELEMDMASESERDLESQPERDLESEPERDLESEPKRDLESELKSELESINKKLETITITLTSPASNRNHKKIASKEPVVALLTPNNLFSLWQRQRQLEDALMEEKSKFIEMANASLNKIIWLNKCATDLEVRLQNEASRFQAKCKKAAGRRRYELLSKATNIMLLKDEIVPNVSLC